MYTKFEENCQKMLPLECEQTYNVRARAHPYTYHGGIHGGEIGDIPPI